MTHPRGPPRKPRKPIFHSFLFLLHQEPKFYRRNLRGCRVQVIACFWENRLHEDKQNGKQLWLPFSFWGHRVSPTASKGIAAQNSPHSQHCTFDSTMNSNCFNGILATTGNKPTVISQKRWKKFLVEANEKNQPFGNHSGCSAWVACNTPAASNCFFITFSSCQLLLWAVLPLATKTKSQLPTFWGKSCCMAARMTRRARLRVTAFPIFLLEAGAGFYHIEHQQGMYKGFSPGIGTGKLLIFGQSTVSHRQKPPKLKNKATAKVTFPYSQPLKRACWCLLMMQSITLPILRGPSHDEHELPCGRSWCSYDLGNREHGSDDAS